MPSPIAHAVSGYVLARFIAPKKLIINQPQWLDIQGLYGVFVAIFADFDFIPQLITGIQFHRGITHTLIFAVGFSLIISIIVATYQKLAYKNLLGLTFFLYCSHLLLDWLTDGGKGIQLLWPFSDTYFASSWSLFPAVHHSRGIWDSSHLIFITWELIYSISIWTIWYLWQNYGQQRFKSKK